MFYIRKQCDKLRKGIIQWLMNYLYVQLSIISNLDIPYVEKKRYVSDIVRCKAFRKYGKIKYADTNNRKVASVHSKIAWDFFDICK